MPIRERSHIIVPKTLRAGRSVNDNRATGLIAPDGHTQPSETRQYYGLPDPSEFLEPGLLGSILDRFLSYEKAYDDFHHEVVRSGIVGRYQHALDLADDPKALAAWKLEPRILSLSRPPTCADDTCRALFQASHRDPKTASKRFKRIEPLWLKRCSAAEVLAFLEKHGVSKPSPKALPNFRKPGRCRTASNSVKANKTLKGSAGGGCNDDQVSASVINEDDPPSGSFHLWPGKIAVNRFYDLRVRVVSYDGEMSVFELLDVSPALVQ